MKTVSARKIITVLLLVSVLLAGCGQKAVPEAPATKAPTTEAPTESTQSDQELAQGIAQEAYHLLIAASEMAEEFGSDTYTAWNDGIHDADESGYNLSKLAQNLDLSVDDLKLGLAYLMNEDEWGTMSEAEKQKEIDEADTTFQLLLMISDSQFSVCVNTVTSAYQMTGKADDIKKNLDEARDLIRTLSNKYPDYKLTDSLKNFHIKIQTYYDYCMNPTGSFKELQNIIQTFRQDVRDAKNELSFDLE